MLAHAIALEQTTTKRVLVKPFVIQSNSSLFTISGIHFGIMPTRVVMGFVKTSAFSGVLKEDPYYFQHIGYQAQNYFNELKICFLTIYGIINTILNSKVLFFNELNPDLRVFHFF